MNRLQKLDRLFQTVRHLKPVQIYGRAWFRLARPRPDLSPAPTLAPAPGPWQSPAARAPSLTGPGQFLFLGVPGDLGRDGWDNPAQSKLWRYNQHYFDDLNAEGAAGRAPWHGDLIARWIAENPPGQGSGWEPYPTSLRIVNWVKWARGGGTLDAAATQSLAVQARWLTKRLEWHLLGNHLFANAKALLFAGLFFDGPEARGWRRTAARILSAEIPEQILADGGQFELTPMYHALAVEDMLDLANLLRAAGPDLPDALGPLLQQITGRLPEMLRWMVAMDHPDGQPSFFNDAAFGIAPQSAQLLAYAARLGLAAPGALPPLCHLRPSGFARLSAGPAVALLDLAAVGPDYLPGHAHADTLSFELSVAGQRVIVNSGTSEYGTGPERLRQRGTPAHSTVTLEGRDSSEVWGGFRVARRATVSDIATGDQDGTLEVSAAHDGYARLPGAPRHSRRWRMTDAELTIEDRILGPVSDSATGSVTGSFMGSFMGTAEARYHLHPEIRVTQDGPQHGRLTLPGGQEIRWQARGGELRCLPGTWHPAFGTSQANTCLVLALKDGASGLTLTWRG